MGQLLALFCALTLLIGNAAAGLASGLARGLALTAAAVFGAITQIPCLKSFNMFHTCILR